MPQMGSEVVDSAPLTERTRLETDSMGPMAVPVDAYYGIHTARALDNFAISGVPLSNYPQFVDALVSVKQAAALANRNSACWIGNARTPSSRPARRSGRPASSTVRRRRDPGRRRHVDQHERQRGRSPTARSRCSATEQGRLRVLHPLEHVNIGQSTNDVYPTAVKVALHVAIHRLPPRWRSCAAHSPPRRRSSRDVLKMGRTQLQDAVPMTLGQEFSHLRRHARRGRAAAARGARCYPRDQPRRDRDRHRDQRPSRLRGAGLPATCREHHRHPARSRRPTWSRRRRTPAPSCSSRACSSASRSSCRRSATTCGCCPPGRAPGSNEINLPPMQAGSIIMPGKVNPVIPEVVNQVAFEVIGNDVTVSMAAEAGQLQLNAFEPIIAHSLFKSVDAPARRLPHAASTSASAGITANRERSAQTVEQFDRHRHRAQSVHRLCGRSAYRETGTCDRQDHPRVGGRGEPLVPAAGR